LTFLKGKKTEIKYAYYGRKNSEILIQAFKIRIFLKKQYIPV